MNARQLLNRELEVLGMQLQTLHQREADFQKILNDMQKLRDDVSKERMALQEKMHELEAQRGLINWLPSELIVQIFLALRDFDFKDTNYRPAVVVSQVCMKWRAIALSAPRLWSRIILQGFRRPEAAQTYLQRSSTAPLAIDYSSSLADRPSQECCQMADFIVKSQGHFGRINHLSLQCKTALPLEYILESIDNHATTFPHLRYLCLSISNPNPSFAAAFSLMERDESTSKAPISRDQVTTSNGLWHLKLEQFPLLNFTSGFVANLRSLELTYSPRTTHSATHDYYLKMSSLCRFLFLTPLLEELILTNTVPFFDSKFLIDDSPDSPVFRIRNVKLDHLKSIEWTYPFACDVHRFLSMIDAPGLEKFDLWVEDPSRQTDTLALRGYQLAASAQIYGQGQGVATYPSLRDLSLQCAGEDTIGSVLRKFSLPALEKLAVTNVDNSARKDTPQLPILPRFESIFRDPRLPGLSHLTLSYFKISPEHGRAEAMLGYMPVLTSLSLDACLGVGRLMEGLQEKVVGTIKPQGPSGEGGGDRQRRGVKVCPRLEALSFWGCQDVDFAGLRAVVLSRNRSTHSSGDECVQKGIEVPNGATHSVTRGAQDGIEGRSHKVEENQMGRKIKPLRKLRHHGHALGSSSSPDTRSPSTNIASSIIAMQEALQPALIIYLRVVDCRLIDREEVMSLRDLGVVDAVWAGSNPC
ncbi:hypothetical protein B0H34DRAFT_542502 [Crassisporium funariophilum]|nr:hypothetical protein B0H34DRAFT_542502 [Crassisporium funariophilum]